MIPHLIVFSDKELQGRHWHIFDDVPNIRDVALTWDDNISSFAVLAGEWLFFRGRDYQDQVGSTFGPGVYPRLADVGVPDDAISSIQLVR
jgi:hypothetical protein